MNSEAAEGAHRFSQLLGDLHDVMMSGVRVIGGALIPYLDGLVNRIVRDHHGRPRVDQGTPWAGDCSAAGHRRDRRGRAWH